MLDSLWSEENSAGRRVGVAFGEDEEETNEDEENEDSSGTLVVVDNELDIG